MCTISLQQGCIRKSDTDSSNNGTFLLLSVTWLPELCKFPAIRFWQVAGNQSNMLYISHIIHLLRWGKKHIQYPDSSQFGAQTATHTVLGSGQAYTLLGSLHKGRHIGHNTDTYQQESFDHTPSSKSQAASRAVIN